VIFFDISRLLSRAGRGTPTGIDRVELAYAQHLIAGPGVPCFTAMAPWGRLALLPRPAVEGYVEALAAMWREGPACARCRWRMRRLALGLRLQTLRRGQHALHVRMRTAAERPVYLLVSHHHLEKRRVIARLKRRGNVTFVCLIHDLIPIEFPRYARAGQDKRHRRRIETAGALADAVIVASSDTRHALQPHFERTGRAPPVLVAPFGVGPAKACAARASLPEAPYFVCVGTIEPRKNHLLLLNLWRQLVAERASAAPRLVLVGRRGWESGNTIDLLDRCPALRGFVLERNRVPDTEMARLLKGARALLLPSFAEGFGFPLVEALALGIPVLCSDIAALRENGGEVPEYFDPLDAMGWRAAIIDYALADSPRRADQLRRLAGWKPATWRDHFAAVEAFVAETAARLAEP
jgi:glycosyltransferase involved in cell wall biosynthesis